MTKKVKRTISVIIAAIMLLSTMSVLALATDLPTYPEATSKEVGPHDHVAAVAAKDVYNANGFLVCAKNQPLYVEDKAAYAQPTCVKPGCQEFYVVCSICGKEMPNTRVKYEIPALESHHQAGPVSIEKVVEPTCAEDGSYYEVVRCVLCNAVLSRTLVAVRRTTAHDPDLPVKENIVDSTCAEVGFYDSVIRCKVCGVVLSVVRKEIPKKAYHVSEYSLPRLVVPQLNDNGTPTGKAYVIFVKAGSVDFENNTFTPLNGYTFVRSDVRGLELDPAGAVRIRLANGAVLRADRVYDYLTETDSGIAFGYFPANRYAANAGTEPVVEADSPVGVPATSFADPTVTGKTRTCADGEERCAICGELLNPQIPHTWDGGQTVIPATLTTQGKIVYHCLIKGCTAEYTTNTAVKAPKKGDVDGDGFVTTADARYILRYAVNLGSYDKVINSGNFDAADVDGNKAVETADARLALRTAVGLRNP